MTNVSSGDRPSTPSPIRAYATWPTVLALSLVTAGFSVMSPLVLIFLPLAVMLVGLEPRKPLLTMVAVALAVSMLTGRSGGLLWWYGRGWALILGAWFIVAIALMPQAKLLTRALGAVAAASVTAALLFLVNREGWTRLDFAVTRQLRDGAADVTSFWAQRVTEKPWAQDLTDAIYRFTDFQANAYPAMLAIASLSALALAWWLWRRLSASDARPLGPLSDFRFRDELIWLLVIGGALVALPLQHAATRTGLNLLVFMAALYAVRGFAVIIALFGSPSLMGALFGVLLFLMLYPIMMATTLMVGLTDTWLDLRARRLTRQDNEKH
jgi:hypothetical protein